jgi:hypothetical protein
MNMTKLIKFPTMFKGIEIQRDPTPEERWDLKDKKGGLLIKELPIDVERKIYYEKKMMVEEEKQYQKELDRDKWKAFYEKGKSVSKCPFKVMLDDKLEEELKELDESKVVDLLRYKVLIDLLKGDDDND